MTRWLDAPKSNAQGDGCQPLGARRARFEGARDPSQARCGAALAANQKGWIQAIEQGLAAVPKQ
jgi:hypothetical protein